MHTRTIASVLFAALGCAAFACGSSSDGNGANTTIDAGGTDAGQETGNGGDAGGDGGASALPFKPSNIDLTGWDLSTIGDVDLSGTNCIVESEIADGMVAFLCDMKFENHVAHKIVTLPDQSKLSIFVMKSLRVEPSTILALTRGHLPVVLVTTGSMELLGSVQVDPGLMGGGFNSGAGNTKGSGPGGGTGGDATGLTGGGGSYCGLGGKAATYTGAPSTAPSAPTPGYGSPELVPLLGGSAGGSGDLTNDGSGGGAVQLVAGTSFVLHQGAFISAGGGGGVFGGTGAQGSGGGGSGGAILIEATTVQIDGAIGANGGGGGQGNGDAGEVAKADVVAKGGHKNTGAQSDPGGDGSFASTLNGGDGVSSATTSASSGGGGAGRVRINTQSGAAKISGSVSPAAGTACFTQGSVKK